MTPTMTLDTLQDLLAFELQELHSAEQQSLQAMPQMMEMASSPQLRQMLQMHIDQTLGQVQRLEHIFGVIGQQPDGIQCQAASGLIEDAQLVLQQTQGITRDAAIIAAQQKMEHLEIACYGTARSHALQLNQSDVAELLQQTLQEEEETDHQLTALAENQINDQADPQHQMGSDAM